MTGQSESRKQLYSFFQAGLQAVNGRLCVHRFLMENPSVGQTALVSIGKAASAMALGAVDALGGQLHSGLVITKQDHLDKACRDNERLTCLEAGHPLPDKRSLIAGGALIDFLEDTHKSAHLLFLISGGASSLVESLPGAMDLDALRKLNVWLLASGLDITKINCIRQSVSRIKGGKLKRWIGQRPSRVLMISDVADNSPDIIGSGLLAESSAGQLEMAGLPGWVHRLLTESVQEAEPGVEKIIPHTVVADIDMALAAAGGAAARTGHAVHIVEKRLTGETTAAGREVVSTLDNSDPGIYLWGGETTIRLPDSPGRGGRCQSLALSAAQSMQGRNDVILLVVGTDGTDGPGTDAGAIVDGTTVSRGRQAGQDPMEALDKADAGTFLAASGDLVTTGATGTNVTDMIIAMKMDTGQAGK